MPESPPTPILPFIWVSGMIVVGLVLLLIIFFLLYQRRLYRHQEELQRIRLQRQVEMLAAVIEGGEIERKRLAHDLHDGVGVMLTTIRMGLWSVEKKLDPAAQAGTAELRAWVDEAMAHVRAVARDLMPPTLARMGLGDALVTLLERAGHAGEIAMHLDLDLQGTRCAAMVEIHIYRIVQELLNNSIRHGKPQNIHFRLHRHDQTLRLQYADDGVGFVLEEGYARGLGHKNIQSRIDLLGGDLQVTAAPGKGVRWEISIPLTEASITVP